MNLTIEEKIKKIKDLRPIDDIFFEVLAENKGVCEEILQTILGDKNLKVIDNVTQNSIRNIYGRSIRLDTLCILGNGTKCNIEVQRSDNDNHLRRARFNASNITVKESNTGENFEKVIDLYIVYISEFDFLKEGKTIYHIDKTIRETGTVVDDGLHEIFVNTVVNDNSDVAMLMSCFMEKEVNNPKFPRLSEEVRRLKTTEGGASAVCEVMEKYKEEAIIQNTVELCCDFGISKEITIKKLMQKFNMSEQVANEVYEKYASVSV